MRARHAVGHGIQRVIGQARAVRVEEIQTGFQRLHHAFQIQAVDAGNAGQAVHVIHKAAALDVEHLVRAPGRIDLEIAGGVLLDQGVMLQIVHRVVGGADDLHAEFLDQAAAAVFLRRQQRVRAVPDILRRLFAQRLIYVKISLKLEVSPVIERIAKKIRHYLRPRHEFFARGGVARDVLFRDAAGAHRAPLVVIAREPEPCYILGRTVFIYFLGRQVTVPVEYRHLVSCGEKLARGVALKQKILVHKSFHSYLLPISR